ncbi:MAG: AraC family transcriptional regulator [Spirochaetales bacterium]|jgi:AraC-like DNA-binding protein|nr:AraC family transcriptional regulator [Spirochaetales bacterium]
MHIIDLMKILDAVFVYQMTQDEKIRWHGRYHKHAKDCFEIHYFLQGVGTFQNGGTVYQISAGSLFITGPSVLHAIQAKNLNDPITYYAVLVSVGDDQRDIHDFLLQKVQEGGKYQLGTNHRFFFEEIREKGMSKDKNLQLSAGYQLISLLYQLASSKNYVYSRLDNVHLEKAIRYMQINVMNSITLEDIARHLRLTESYFIRLFKRRFQATPMKYYTKLKIEAASALLTETEFSVKEIAAKLNFYSEFHFSRTFKHYTGMAPTVYRSAYLQQIGGGC